jgi:hypothetical protein
MRPERASRLTVNDFLSSFLRSRAARGGQALSAVEFVIADIIALVSAQRKKLSNNSGIAAIRHRFRARALRAGRHRPERQSRHRSTAHDPPQKLLSTFPIGGGPPENLTRFRSVDKLESRRACR